MNAVRTSKAGCDWCLHVCRVVAGLALAVLVVGCSVTQKEKPELTGGHCAIIPPQICSQMVPGTSEQAGLHYITYGVQWNQYTKVMIDPVTLWSGEEATLSASDSQMLCNYFFNALVKALGAKVQLGNEAGPGVMRLQAAIMGAETATPVLRSISMLVPQARVLGTLKYAATGTYPFVGGAQGEILATDSVSGRVLGAAVDRRVGGGSMQNVAVWQWGDAENAMDKWAELTATRMQELQAGKGLQ